MLFRWWPGTTPKVIVFTFSLSRAGNMRYL